MDIQYYFETLNTNQWPILTNFVPNPTQFHHLSCFPFSFLCSYSFWFCIWFIILDTPWFVQWVNIAWSDHCSPKSANLTTNLTNFCHFFSFTTLSHPWIGFLFALSIINYTYLLVCTLMLLRVDTNHFKGPKKRSFLWPIWPKNDHFDQKATNLIKKRRPIWPDFVTFPSSTTLPYP